MKRLLGITMLLALSLSVFAGCSSTDASDAVKESKEMVQENTTEDKDTEMKAEYHKISQDKAKEMIDAGGVVVIDVREDYEYADGHIDGAVLSPLGNIDSDITNHVSGKDDVILIYCRSGNRSQTASNILVDLGYTNVYDFGGIITWEYGTVK